MRSEFGTVEKAEGFLALGLSHDAWEALEDLPPESKNNQRRGTSGLLWLVSAETRRHQSEFTEWA